jgi:general secretion pathway protein M
MKQWFGNLAPREQLLVSLAAVLTVIVLVYLLVWLPLETANSRLESRVESQREIVSELRQLQGRVPAPSGGSGTRAPTEAGQSLVVVVDSTVRQRGLGTTLKRSQPTGADSIRVVFENASFDTLVGWLGQLANGHAIRIDSASFSNRPEPGRVDATLTLRRTL